MTTDVIAPTVETPPAEELHTPPASDQSWESLMHSDDDDGALSPDVETPATPPVVDTPPPAVEPAPAAPVVEPPPTPVAQSTPPAPAAPQLTAEETAAAQQQAVTKALEELAAKYQITDDQLPEILVNPEKVLPKLLAQAHMNAVRDTLQLVQQSMPQMFEQVTTHKANTQKSVDAFYSEWPELNKPEYQQQIAASVVAYRKANPQATAEQVIKAGGALACISLGLPVPDRFTGATTPALGAAAPVSVPRQPAAPAGAVTPSAPRSENQFTQLAEEFLSDE